MELDFMVNLQKKLVARYVEMGSLPESIDIHKKPGQKLLRELCFYLVVELHESFETLVEIISLCEVNKPQEAFELLDNFNEELADCWHFLLEIHIYAGFTNLNIYQYLKKYATERNLIDIIEPDNNLLEEMLMLMAKFQNHQSFESYRGLNGYVITNTPKDLANKGLTGLKLSMEVLEYHQSFLFYIEDQYLSAINQLKKKDWSVGERESDLTVLNDKLFNGFLMMVRYMEFMGKDFKRIHHIYELKNKKCHERIDNGY